MSLILDALRKSEAERRRGEAPDLYSQAPSLPTQPRTPWRSIAVGAGIAMAVVGVSLWVWRSGPADERGGALAPPPAAEVLAPTTAAAEVESFPPPSEVTPSAPAASVPPAPTLPPPPAVAGPVARAMPPVSAPPSPDAELPPAAPADAPLPASIETPLDEVAPIAVLSVAERASLPPLKLSMHVWNSDPARRFAIVDGQRMAEGAMVGNAVVEEIRRDGVVLNINGRRLLLSRP